MISSNPLLAIVTPSFGNLDSDDESQDSSTDGARGPQGELQSRLSLYCPIEGGAPKIVLPTPRTPTCESPTFLTFVSSVDWGFGFPALASSLMPTFLDLRDLSWRDFEQCEWATRSRFEEMDTHSAPCYIEDPEDRLDGGFYEPTFRISYNSFAGFQTRKRGCKNWIAFAFQELVRDLPRPVHGLCLVNLSQDEVPARREDLLLFEQCHGRPVTELAWLEKKQWLASVSRDRTARFWDVGSIRPRATRSVAFDQPCLSCKECAARNCLIVGMESKIVLLSVNSFRSVQEFAQSPVCVTVHPSSGMLLFADKEETVSLWDSKMTREPVCRRTIENGVSNFVWLDDDRLITCSGSGKVEFWNGTTLEPNPPLHPIETQGDSVLSMCFVPEY